MTKAEIERLKQWKKAMDELNRQEAAESRKLTYQERFRDLEMLFETARRYFRQRPAEPSPEEVENWVRRREKLAAKLGL